MIFSDDIVRYNVSILVLSIRVIKLSDMGPGTP